MNIYVTNFSDGARNGPAAFIPRNWTVHWLTLVKGMNGCKKAGNYALPVIDDEVQAWEAIKHPNGNC